MPKNMSNIRFFSSKHKKMSKNTYPQKIWSQVQNEYENGRGYAHDAYAHVPEHTHISSIFGYLWAWQVVLGLPHVGGHGGDHW